MVLDIKETTILLSVCFLNSPLSPICPLQFKTHHKEISAIG